MTAAAQLRDAGFGLSLRDDGALIVRPAAKLTDDLRQFIRAHLVELKAELQTPANDPELSPKVKAWTIRFVTGAQCTAINTTQADQAAMTAIARETFGIDAVLGVEVQR